MGQPLLPWQRYVADVALEIDPSTGRFVYSKILGTVQRQAGKTTLDLSTNVQNALMPSINERTGQRTPRKVWYTAQSGQHASEKFLDQMDNLWSPAKALSRLAKQPRRSNGSQLLKFLQGSEFRPHPPTADSLHSKQSDKNTIDELWAFTTVQYQALLGAISPTTTTRQMATGQRTQLWLWSTEGTIESTALNEELERARAGDPAVCFFDWGIPKDADPTDLKEVARWHPGYGHLFDMSVLRDRQGELPPGEFARAYGNRRTGSSERLLPEAAWSASRFSDPIPEGARVAIGAARGVDDVDTTIALAGRDAQGRMIVEVYEWAPGTHWATQRIVDIALASGAPVAVDRYGPSAALYDELARAGVTLVPLTTSAVSAACSNVYTGITAPKPTWLHRPHPQLEDAAELAARKWVSDGAWVFGRRASVGSISSLEACALAAWAVDHLPEERAIQLA